MNIETLQLVLAVWGGGICALVLCVAVVRA